MLDLRRPWRLGIFLAALMAGLLSGFRSSLIFFIWNLRRDVLPRASLSDAIHGVLIGAMIHAGTAVLIPNVTKLPPASVGGIELYPVINVDPVAKERQRFHELASNVWKELLDAKPPQRQGFSLRSGRHLPCQPGGQNGSCHRLRSPPPVTGIITAARFLGRYPGLWGSFAFLVSAAHRSTPSIAITAHGDPCIQDQRVVIRVFLSLQTFLFFVTVAIRTCLFCGTGRHSV